MSAVTLTSVPASARKVGEGVNFSFFSFCLKSDHSSFVDTAIPTTARLASLVPRLPDLFNARFFRISEKKKAERG